MSTRFENPQQWIAAALELLKTQPEGSALEALGGYLVVIDGYLIGTPSISFKQIDPDYVTEVWSGDWGLTSWDGYSEEATDAALNDPSFISIGAEALAEIHAAWEAQQD